MKEKELIRAAKYFSLCFTPLIVPFTGFTALLFLSYLNVFPLLFKLLLLAMVYLFTVLAPKLMIRLYRYINGWTSRQMGKKERRIVPYALSITCYIFCLLLMYRLHLPHFMTGILVASLMGLIACAVINIWWKISAHMAGIGGITGGLILFSHLFSFNPVWYLCLALLLSGLLGTCRIILRQHTLAQVFVGWLVGFLCGMFGLMINVIN